MGYDLLDVVTEGIKKHCVNIGSQSCHFAIRVEFCVNEKTAYFELLYCNIAFMNYKRTYSINSPSVRFLVCATVNNLDLMLFSHK